MPNLTGVTTTPQPFPNPTAPDQIARNSQESEKWDDLLAVIYSSSGSNAGVIPNNGAMTTITSVQVACPMVLRLELRASWYPTVFADATNGTGLSLQFLISPVKGGSAGVAVPVGPPHIYQPPNSQNVELCFSSDATYDVLVPSVYLVTMQGQATGPSVNNPQIGPFSLVVRRGRKPVT